MAETQVYDDKNSFIQNSINMTNHFSVSPTLFTPQGVWDCGIKIIVKDILYDDSRLKCMS